MEINAAPASDTADREMTMTRRFDAPRELVWRAWTEAGHLAQWWGPTGFTNTIHEMDVRPGGVLRVLMHGPDGTDYPNKIVYTEVVAPERLAYWHGDDVEEGGIHFEVTVSFTAIGDETEITVTMLFQTAETKRQALENSAAKDGSRQTMDRLRDHLKTMDGGR